MISLRIITGSLFYILRRINEKAGNGLDNLASRNVQLNSLSGSLPVRHDVEVDVPFEVYSSLSDSTVTSMDE